MLEVWRMDTFVAPQLSLRESGWRVALEGLPQWSPPQRQTVVISPHPDDETLGAGGLIASQRQFGLPVIVIAVTDGEAVYNGAPGIATLRRAEQIAALAELGIDAPAVIRLGLPDGGVAAMEDELEKLVAPFVQRDTLLVSTWRHDPHADHEACGRVAERLAMQANAELISYMFWAWQSNSVESMLGLPMHRFELSKQIQAARAVALAHYQSQFQWEDGQVSLPPEVLGPAQRSFETFIISK